MKGCVQWNSFFFSVFQSYQDDVMVIMKDCVQGNSFFFSMSVISGRWKDANERPYALALDLWLKRLLSGYRTRDGYISRHSIILLKCRSPGKSVTL